MRRPNRKRHGRSRYRQTLTAEEIASWFKSIDDIRQHKHPNYHKKPARLPVKRREFEDELDIGYSLDQPMGTA